MKMKIWMRYFCCSGVAHISFIMAIIVLLNLNYTDEKQDENYSVQVNFVEASQISTNTNNINGNLKMSMPGVSKNVRTTSDGQNIQQERNSEQVLEKNSLKTNNDIWGKNVVSESINGTYVAESGSRSSIGDFQESSGGGTGNRKGAASSNNGGGFGPGFSENSDGSYTASNDVEGIDYTILNDAEAIYPEEARSIGYSRTVKVEGQILVGLNGSVEEVTILNDVPRLGFREAATEAFWNMKFLPIYYHDTNIKKYFVKTIYFQSN
ncbi:MAG: energy transducer TonB [Proteocatella sp.]